VKSLRRDCFCSFFRMENDSNVG